MRGDVQVLVVSAGPLARASLSRALATEPGITIVGRTGPGAELSEEITRLNPHVLLFDAGLQPALLPGSSGDPPSPAVWLVPDAEAVLLALKAGAAGVLRRDSEPSTVAGALRAASEGLAVLEPGLLRAALQGEAESPRDGDELTARERQVLDLLARGLTNKSIAETLEISEHTAKFHVNSLLSKLGAQSRTEVVVRAARRGWITL